MLSFLLKPSIMQYTNDDEAVATRQHLHNSTWPLSNPKTLLVDFASQEQVLFDDLHLSLLNNLIICIRLTWFCSMGVPFVIYEYLIIKLALQG